MPEAPSLAIGALLGARYRIEARIGAGGMGVVYRAQDERLGRAVALKVVSQKGGATAVRRLQREARAVASLDHRGIAMLFDVLDVREVGVVLVMELVRGESLRTLIEAEGARPPREAARLVLDVAESLGAAHRAGLVHRDVKPDNILLRPDGRTALLDFGIAKAITDRSEDSSRELTPIQLTSETAEGMVVGTPAYLAPEQALASADISGAADQFALAVVAYELLTGVSPWRGATSGALLIAQIVRAQPEPPSRLRPELGAGVDDVIGRALKKEPSARFATIEEFGLALLGAVGQAVGASSAPKLGVRKPRPLPLPFARTLRVPINATTAEAVHVVPKRRPLTAPLTLATFAVLLVTAVFGARGLHRPAPQSSASDAPASSKAATAPLPYAELPRSSTPSVDADVALHNALLAVRDANDALAEADLNRAIKLDPSFISAYLQRALLLRLHSWDGLQNQLDGREDFVAATSGRDSLGHRDRAVLDAFEPVFNQLPSDVAATEKRLTALATDSADAQIWHLLARARRQLEMIDGAKVAYDRELPIDPQSATGLSGRAAIFVARGDLDHAAASYEECFRTQPGASRCRFNLAFSLQWNGRCEAFVQRSREYAALAPADENARYLKLLADATSGLSQDVLADDIRTLTGTLRTNEEAWSHEIRGDFGTSVHLLESLESRALAERDTVDFVYARAARLVDLWEMGNVAEATSAALSYDAKVAALPPLDDVDQLPFVLSLLRHAGKMSPAEVKSRRQAWIERWLPQYSTPRQRFLLWISAWARGALDEDDAREAVAALPAFVDELPPSSLFWLPQPWWDRESIARTLVLAGHPRARSFLDDALRECVPNYFGTRLQLWAGELAEREGDVPRACTAYGIVNDRWGGAKPRSISADAARARARALGCGPR